ncbi:hypothetical protein SFRURICE_018762 [Spodoptera frugiperda]|nr:hypothetical protein SFRURICE_018762 [Spodoptera frugiperda]
MSMVWILAELVDVRHPDTLFHKKVMVRVFRRSHDETTWVPGKVVYLCDQGFAPQKARILFVSGIEPTICCIPDDCSAAMPNCILDNMTYCLQVNDPPNTTGEASPLPNLEIARRTGYTSTSDSDFSDSSDEQRISSNLIIDERIRQLANRFLPQQVVGNGSGAAPQPIANGAGAQPLANGAAPQPLANGAAPQPLANGVAPQPMANVPLPHPMANAAAPQLRANGAAPHHIANGAALQPIYNRYAAPQPMANRAARQLMFNGQAAPQPIIYNRHAAPQQMIYNRQAAPQLIGNRHAAPQPMVNNAAPQPMVNNAAPQPIFNRNPAPQQIFNRPNVPQPMVYQAPPHVMDNGAARQQHLPLYPPLFYGLGPPPVAPRLAIQPVQPVVNGPPQPPAANDPISPPIVNEPALPAVNGPAAQPVVDVPVPPPVNDPVPPPVDNPVPPQVADPVPPPVDNPVPPPVVDNPVPPPVDNPVPPQVVADPVPVPPQVVADSVPPQVVDNPGPPQVVDNPVPAQVIAVPGPQQRVNGPAARLEVDDHPPNVVDDNVPPQVVDNPVPLLDVNGLAAQPEVADLVPPPIDDNPAVLPVVSGPASPPIGNCLASPPVANGPQPIVDNPASQPIDTTGDSRNNKAGDYCTEKFWKRLRKMQKIARIIDTELKNYTQAKDDLTTSSEEFDEEMNAQENIGGIEQNQSNPQVNLNNVHSEEDDKSVVEIIEDEVEGREEHNEQRRILKRKVSLSGLVANGSRSYLKRRRNSPSISFSSIRKKCHNLVEIGTGVAKVPGCIMTSIDWSSHSLATRQLLLSVFPRSVLAQYSLLGTQPSIYNMKRETKRVLNPMLVEDIVRTVASKCNVPKDLVRVRIKAICREEIRIFRQNERKMKHRRRHRQQSDDYLLSTSSSSSEELVVEEIYD